MHKKILIDWFSSTRNLERFVCSDDLSPENVLQSLNDFLGASLPWQSVAPRNGYQVAYSCSRQITAMWQRKEGDLFLDFTGEGCRLIETLSPDFNWFGFIAAASQHSGYHCSRLDVACDTFGELSMRSIIRYSLDGRYISRWRLPPRIVQGREETVDFGSPQSRTMLRIYNKTLERQCRVATDIKVPEKWVRVELQMRNEACESFHREWMACGDLGRVYFGIVGNQLRFVKERFQGHSERSMAVQWWSHFLEGHESLALAYAGGLDYNFDSLRRYTLGQAGSSIHTYLMATDWDIDQLIQQVKHRQINARQRALLVQIGVDVI